MSSTETDAYDALASPTASHAAIPVTSKTLYDHDLVMVFPRREGGELKKPEDFTVRSFVRLFLGKDLARSQRSKTIVVDPFQRVLRTSRCFLDDRGRPVVEDTSHDHSDASEQRRLEMQEQLLEHEYEQFIGSREATIRGQVL
uniref:Uncharacterized protein n=1 Tax=Peronospora matthiolae TaxID=2874970 RepID=A0AAV1TWX0_9STRA